MVHRQLRPTSVLHMESLTVVDKKVFNRVLCERRLMAVCTLGTVAGIVLLLISAGTCSWAIVEVAAPNNLTEKLYLGIWGEWQVLYNGSRKMEDYYRTQAVFSIIALSIMIISNTFAFYTFRHHRYMYKRLTAGLDMIVAMCIFVTIETISHSVNNWKAISMEHHSTNVYDDYLRGMSFGYSTILAWFVFVAYLCASIVFILAGRKQKGDHAAALEFEVEDRPFILGR